MHYTTLITADALHQNLDQADWVIVDCRFSLADASAGASAYRRGHLPNARYADLNKDLSSAVKSYTGRHPLPDAETFSRKLGEWGIGNNTQVIAYDDADGAFAARLWWLLRWVGLTRVAVLDGGLPYWKKQGLPLTTHLPQPKTTHYRSYQDNSLWLSALDVQNHLAQKTIKLLDARTAVRYRGEQEPIDPIAGHVPGALNYPMQCNLDAQHLFLPASKLKKQFQQLIDTTPSEQIVHMCGSGVTACHNLLAMEHAGLIGSKLYAGSWSEWITNKNREVARN